MPELPEVETIVRYLRPKIRGKRILRVEVKTPRLFRDYRSPKEALIKIAGKKIEEVDRAGKNLLFRLNDGSCFLIHLMMTGRLFFNPVVSAIHDRMNIYLSGGDVLVFNDIRKFGRCRIVAAVEGLVGREPLQISFPEFQRLVASRKAGIIKRILLNQKFLAGIGNIYSDEILWYAGIGPMRNIATLTPREIKKLYGAMRHVLLLAIQKGGTSARDYLKPDGKPGGYYKIRKAYQRTGEKCSRDNASIKRIKIGQRSAHFCPKHQV